MNKKSPWRPIRTFRKPESGYSFEEFDLWMCGSSGFGSFFEEPEGFRVPDCHFHNGKWSHQTGVLGLETKELKEENITHWMRPPKGPKLK